MYMKKVLNDYKLTAGIHTISIKTSDEFYATPEMTQINTNLHSGISTIRINVNKMSGFVTTYCEFQEKLQIILDTAGIKNYQLIRVDMCFDSYDSDHYIRYAKLNRLLISMIAEAYTVYNTYRTTDLFTNRQLSVAIKNPNSFEVENYDKERESKGKDPAKSRFEIRSLRMNGKDIEKEFCYNWDIRFIESLNHYEETLQHYNRELYQAFLNEQKRGRNIKWSIFFHMYENCIFSRKQAIELLSMLGVKNPEERYKYFKKKHKLETYNFSDIKNIVREIQRARDAFFMGSKNTLPINETTIFAA